MNLKQAVFAAFILSLPLNLQAKTYKCTGKDGKVSYGTSPCKEEQVEKEIKEIKASTEYDPVQAEKDRLAIESAQQRMASWQNYKDNKVKENCRIRLNQELSKRLVNPDAIRTLTDCVNGGQSSRASADELDSREAKFHSEKSRMENELRLKKMDLQNKEIQHKNEIHRMENQQRLKEMFPPP